MPNLMKAVGKHQKRQRPRLRPLHQPLHPHPPPPSRPRPRPDQGLWPQPHGPPPERGELPLPPQAPSTLGVEFSGTIVSFGGDDPNQDQDQDQDQDHEHKFKKGDEVFGLAYGGAYAEYISVSTRMLLHKPSWLSFEQAAGVPETWITALQALDFVLGGAKGKTILWHAGASSVSISGVQLSRVSGAREIFATAGTGEKVRFIEGTLGATKGFNYKSEDWVKGVLEATGGKGVDLVVDFVGGSYFEKNLDVVARDGRIVMLGLMGGMQTPDKVNVGKLLYKRARVEGSTLRSRDEDYQGKLRDRLEQEYLPKFEKGELKVFIDRVLPWEDIQKGHEVLERNETMGKVICTIR